MTSLLSFLINPLREVLVFFHNNLHLSWALSIILLTVIIRMILIPLTAKQYTSMRAMQKLQPKMKELQKKFKDDRQKLNEEVMKLYKEHKVNPFGSCLPLLIQLPITMALYYMIRSQHLTGDVSFLWIHNINNADHILVGIYVASQMASSVLLTTTTDKSQRLLMLLMPLFIGVVTLGFPAGALLFWATSNILMVGQQLIVREFVKKREAQEELALETGVPVAPVKAAAPPAEKSGGKKYAAKSKSKKKKRR